MKKLGTLLLCAGLLFSTAACSRKDAVDEKALDKLEAVKKQTMKYQSASYELDVKFRCGQGICGNQSKRQFCIV